MSSEKEFDLDNECECFECSVQGRHSNAQKCAQEGFRKGQEQAAKRILGIFEAETDPDSWGTFALPRVREVIAKVLEESK